MYNVLDFDVFNSTKYKTKKASKVKQFLYVGRICEGKGIEELINAYASMKKQNEDVVLLIAGFRQKEKQSLFERKMKKMAIKNGVKSIGYLSPEEVAKTIANSFCVIVPSTCNEAFGMVALEAMAMGKPLITTNAGGLSELANEECAIILDYNKVGEELTGAMEKLCSNNTLADCIASNARKKAISTAAFDRKNYYDYLSKILEREGKA